MISVRAKSSFEEKQRCYGCIECANVCHKKSGGAFTATAQYVPDYGGVVFGTANMCRCRNKGMELKLKITTFGINTMDTNTPP